MNVWRVHGQRHVMVQFNLKREKKGRPFEVCRVSQPVPSTNYVHRETDEHPYLCLYPQNYWRESTSTGSSYFEFQVQNFVHKAEIIEEKHPSLRKMQDKRISVNIDNVQEHIGRRRACEEVYTSGYNNILNNITCC